uniref:Transposon MuDR mudrA n=1 Tax=Solanum tuberosum TaxID=4113 RepID=M1DYB9_SOLTU
MVDKVDLLFYYGGFSKVQQLLLKGPSGRYYLIEGDSGIRTIQTSLSVRSGVLELFVVDEGDDVVPAIDISHNNEPYLVTIDAATEGETSEEENDENEPYLVTIDAATEGETSEEENDENEPYLVTIDAATEGETSEEENDENEPYLVTIDAATEGETSEEENDENEPYLVTIDAATEGETSEEENDENEPYLVTLDAATEGESSEEENEPYPSDYNSEDLESFRLEKEREVNDQLDNFKELEKGMSFKNIEEAKRVLQKGGQVLQAPQPSEENELIFMPTPGFVASSSRQTSQQSSQAFNEALGPSKSKRKNVSKDRVDAIPKRSKNSGKEIVVALSIATVDEDEVEDGIESEDEDTVFAPRMISEEKTRLQMKKLQQQPIGSRRISFMGDENAASIPTNLPYSPKKLTWKGKACVTSNQLTKDKEKKIGKLKTKRGKH